MNVPSQLSESETGAAIMVPLGSPSSSLSFPHQLHFVLAEMERDGQAHIASWQPHGRAFKVHDREQFVKTILPRWFRQSKYASFQRQLNIYGFSRVCAAPDNPDSQSYYHEKFLRSQPELVREIKRMAVKGQGPRRSSSPSNVPNFNRLPPCPSSSSVASRIGATGPNEEKRVLNATAVASPDGNDAANGFGGRLTGGDLSPTRLLSVTVAHPAATQGMVLVPPALLGLNIDSTGSAAQLASSSGAPERLDLQSLLEYRQQQSDAQSALRRDELLSLLREQQQRANGHSRGNGISATAARTPDSSVLLRQLHEARYLEQARQHAHRNELLRLLVTQSHEARGSTTLASSPLLHRLPMLPVAAAAAGHAGHVWTNNLPLSASQQQQLEQLRLLELLNRPINP